MADQVGQIAERDVRVHEVEAPGGVRERRELEAPFATGVTRRTFAPPAREQRPVTPFGIVAQGVFGCGRRGQRAPFASVPITLGANGLVA